MSDAPKPNSGRKLFFGLFVFPLLIAVGMAVLLCGVIFLTHEDETPESLIAAIKSGSPSKRWQKAYELSNELNSGKASLRSEGVMREIISIVGDPKKYDAKTRGYMVVALSHFKEVEAVSALRRALADPDESIQLYSLWSLGVQGSKDAASDIPRFLRSENGGLRKMAVYVLGVLGDKKYTVEIRPLLKDPQSDVAWNAALALARLGDDAGQSVLLGMLDREGLTKAHMLQDPQIEEVMINATKGLALIQSSESIKILESIARSDKSLKVRQAAITAVKAITRKDL
ncbi:MAG TPA: HEAT repeat domain-containing protein [Candidatus Omnitrophota bacterium]|nr:HEAT repeat domain-containing protein [Candidatus Omnitrophota bacterium]